MFSHSHAVHKKANVMLLFYKYAEVRLFKEKKKQHNLAMNYLCGGPPIFVIPASLGDVGTPRASGVKKLGSFRQEELLGNHGVSQPTWAVFLNQGDGGFFTGLSDAWESAIVLDRLIVEL